MVTLDLARLSHGEIEEAVVYQCGRFGTVQNIRIMPPVKNREYAIAIVTMASEAESATVENMIGDMRSGRRAIIKLLQEERQIPASLKRTVDADAGLSA